MWHFSLKNIYIYIYERTVFADGFVPLSPTPVSLLHNTPSNNPTYCIIGPIQYSLPTPVVWEVEITQLFSLLC